jgi:hypothetical protein
MPRSKRPPAEVLEEEKAIMRALVDVFSAHHRNAFLPRLARGDTVNEAGNLHQNGLREALLAAVASAVNGARTQSTLHWVQQLVVDGSNGEQIGRELEKLSGPQQKPGERCRCNDHAAFKAFASSFGIETETRRETRSQELPIEGGLTSAATSSDSGMGDAAGSTGEAACAAPPLTRAGERIINTYLADERDRHVSRSSEKSQVKSGQLCAGRGPGGSQ